MVPITLGSDTPKNTEKWQKIIPRKNITIEAKGKEKKILGAVRIEKSRKEENTEEQRSANTDDVMTRYYGTLPVTFDMNSMRIDAEQLAKEIADQS